MPGSTTVIPDPYFINFGYLLAKGGIFIFRHFLNDHFKGYINFE